MFWKRSPFLFGDDSKALDFHVDSMNKYEENVEASWLNVEHDITCPEDQQVSVYIFLEELDLAQRSSVRETWAHKRLYWLTKAGVYFVVRQDGLRPTNCESITRIFHLFL